jgi:hypothetical protein
MTSVTSIALLAAPRAAQAADPPAVAACESAAVLDRVGKGLRGARARTGMCEADVVAILERQGIPLSASALREAESSGVVSLGLAACLADIYGTTTDGIAGRRLHRKRLSLDDLPSDTQG